MKLLGHAVAADRSRRLESYSSFISGKVMYLEFLDQCYCQRSQYPHHDQKEAKGLFGCC